MLAQAGAGDKAELDRWGAGGRNAYNLPAMGAWTVCGVAALAALGAGCGGAAPAGAPSDDSRWAAWPMPNAPADVAAGAPNPMAYTVNHDGTVTDQVTGLMWQQGVPAQQVPWADAVAYCADVTLAGHSDWRVPTEIELVSLIDGGVSSGPVIDAAAFAGTPAGYYWSSLPMADRSGNAWLVDFNSGSAYDAAVDGPEYVRCVRSPGDGARESNRRYAIATQTVHDDRTGLTWQRATAPTTLDRAGARSYCASAARVETLGGEGWRLPTGKELLTLVDYNVGPPGPTIDSSAFPETPGAFFWSATELTVPTPAVMFVDFGYGHATNYAVGPTSHVRCVR
jgi:hypothetical protein